MNRTLSTTTMPQTLPLLPSWILPETALSWYAAPTELETLAAGFAPISLKQMESVALLNRTDTKFVMSTVQLLKALAELQNDYWMLAINGRRLNHYRTLYFDTCGFEFYHAHVNGRADRYKVRSREYTDSHLSFLEVKHKTRKDRTIKDRIPTTRPVMEMTSETTNWLHSVSPLNGSTLEPKIWNTFTRMTLVSKQYCERVTLDVDLAFSTDSRTKKLDGIVIAEVKMDANNQASPFLAQMRIQKIRQRGFNKYTFGVAMMCDQVKKNIMKPKMLWIDKMMGAPVS